MEAGAFVIFAKYSRMVYTDVRNFARSCVPRVQRWLHRHERNTASINTQSARAENGYRAGTGRVLLVNVLAACLHEPWRDETQSWLIARDLSLDEMFATMSAEGHPCLWFLLLALPAKLGLSYWSAEALSLALMLWAGYAFLRHSPFPRSATLLIFFSSLFFYYLPVISRSYALIPPLLMLLYTQYPTRAKRPYRYAVTLALLCQTHVILCGMVGTLMALWFFEQLARLRKDGASTRTLLAPTAIMLAGVALLYCTLRLSVADNAAVAVRSFATVQDSLWALYYNACELLSAISFISLYANNWLSALWVLPAFGLLLYGLLLWFRSDWKTALCLVISVG